VRRRVPRIDQDARKWCHRCQIIGRRRDPRTEDRQETWVLAAE